jgi:hypothetical protein
MSVAPQWATDLLWRVADDEGRLAIPSLTWRRAGKRWHGARPQSSSGHWNPEKWCIVVTAGASRRDQKLCLLHEAAHWLAPEGEHHGDTFWVIAFRLFRRYGVPMRLAKESSLRYRKGAIVGVIADRKERQQPDDEWGISAAMRGFASEIDRALAPVSVGERL